MVVGEPGGVPPAHGKGLRDRGGGGRGKPAMCRRRAEGEAGVFSSLSPPPGGFLQNRVFRRAGLGVAGDSVRSPFGRFGGVSGRKEGMGPPRAGRIFAVKRFCAG